MRPLSPKLIEVLRGSLERIQKAIDLDPFDPALVRLKSSILRSMGDLEISKARSQPRAKIVQILPQPAASHSQADSDSSSERTDAA